MSLVDSLPINILETVDRIEIDILWCKVLGEKEMEVSHLWDTYKEDDLEMIYAALRERGFKMVTFVGATNSPVLLIYW